MLFLTTSAVLASSSHPQCKLTDMLIS